jgi:hypothetical protein
MPNDQWGPRYKDSWTDGFPSVNNPVEPNSPSPHVSSAISTDSPAFTGVPTTPTADPMSTSVQIATTEYVDCAVRVEVLRALAAEFGGEGGSYFEYTQSTPASVWNIQHNLGLSPAIVVQDSTNTQVLVETNFVDSNNVILNFSGAETGIVTLIG